LPVLADLRPLNNTKAGLLRGGKLPLDRYCHRVSRALFYHPQDRLERERARAHTHNCKCMFKATQFGRVSPPNGHSHAPARASHGIGAYIYARARARAHERLRTRTSSRAQTGGSKCSAAPRNNRHRIQQQSCYAESTESRIAHQVCRCADANTTKTRANVVRACVYPIASSNIPECFQRRT
jgi:hypothetical protein